MYAEETSYHAIYQLLKNVITNVLPVKMLGKENYGIFLSMLKQFISMKRY
jgi:hypothetical protein